MCGIEQEERIVGVVEAIYFENPSNLYKVVRISVDLEQTDLLIDNEIVITGHFASLHQETEYEFFGKMTQHPKYGEQFAVSRYQQNAPTSQEGLVDYLSSHRFKGVGKVLASRIVDELGLNAIDKILDNRQSLDSVTGLSNQVASNLYEQLVEHQGTERVFMRLNQWGFGPKLVEKIYTKFQSNAVSTIEENPYVLVDEIEGIGFSRADQLAEQLGIEAFDINRLIAGIYTAVNEVCQNEGDTYLERESAIKEGIKLLEASRPFMINETQMEEALEKALREEKLYSLDGNLMIPSLYHAELNIVRKMDDYLNYENVERFSEEEIEDHIEIVIEETGIQYDERQREALKLAIKSPMSIVTGGPGTGKTTLIQGLIHLHALLHEYDLEEVSSKKYDSDRPILLAAPTGRAAKRMQETTGVPASTIHRLIGFTRESLVEEFHSIELEGDLIIVDEMSMVDTWLMNWLIQAIPYHMQVVFVGDKDQLPSVGPGKVFSDLIESNTLPTISLTKIYRQAQNSSIVRLAHEIRKGHLPSDFLEKQADRSFIPSPGSQVGSVVHQIVNAAIKKGFDSNSLQVLAPMYKGTAGIDYLNTILQNLLNPAKDKKRELIHFDRVFRVGDKVLQLVNNTEEDVYNGDIGKIEAIFYKKETESKSDEVIVSFDEKELTYRRSEMDQLTLAYCTSIHKAQGNEFPLVILPLVDLYSRMLRKDLLYTAITRAQSSLVMVGNPACFEKAVTSYQSPRKTNLCDLLQVKIKAIEGIEKIEKEESDQQTQVENQSNEETISNEVVVEQTQLSLDGFDTTIQTSKEGVENTKDKSYDLTLSNWTLIDPMIGMEGTTPFDFMKSAQ